MVITLVALERQVTIFRENPTVVEDKSHPLHAHWTELRRITSNIYSEIIPHRGYDKWFFKCPCCGKTLDISRFENQGQALVEDREIIDIKELSKFERFKQLFLGKE